jgi:uncharacterized protein
MTRLVDASNHLLKLAQLGERSTSLAAAVLVVIAIVGLSPLAELPFVAWLRAVEAPSAVIETVRLIVVFGLYFLLLGTWLKLHEKRPLQTVGLERNGALRRYLRGVLVALFMYSMVVANLTAFGYIRVDESNMESAGFAALPSVLVIFLAWMIQGSAEEALYRGWLFPTLTVRYGPLIGLGISGLLFMAAHSLGAGFSPLAALNLLLFAAFATFYALREESLWGIAGWHAAWNWVQGNLFGLPVSGYEIGGTLVNLRITQWDWVSGGTFGPEGGIVVSAVLAIAVVGLIVTSQRDKRGKVDEPIETIDDFNNA